MIPTANGPVHNHRELESLPFLLACVREGLRLATGVSGRLPRVNPHADVIYAGKHLIPAGQVVSMNIRDIHYDPAVFDNPTEFRPDRWLEGDVKTLEKYLVPFSRYVPQSYHAHSLDFSPALVRRNLNLLTFPPSEDHGIVSARPLRWRR